METDARYELMEKLASGSFATVYRARDLELGREVAVKQIHQQFLEAPKQLERYWQEAQLLASLHHPNIVTIFDIVRERGWLIMELMQANMGARQAGRPLDLTSVRTTLAHCLRALKFLHEHGIVHGDIKPGNMMIDRRKRVKIGDFGLARRVSDDDGSLLKGTTKYMAPEVVSDDFGEVGPASDLYSLGFAAYELLCGKNFESLFPGLSAFGRDKQVAWMMWHAAPDRRLPEIKRVLEGVPEDLAHVIQKLTAKKQSERYRNADQALMDLKIDLRAVKSGDDSGDESAKNAPGAERKRRLLVIGAFAFSVAMSLAILLMPTGKQPQRRDVAGKAGIVREVLASEQKLVLEDVETGVPEEITIEEKPRIYLRNTDKNILLRELQPGDRISIQRDPGQNGTGDNGTAGVRYLVSRPLVSVGRIKRLDAPNQQFVLGIEEGPVRDDLLIQFPERSKIRLNGQEVKLADLEADDAVEVRHFADVKGGAHQIAESIEAKRVMRLTGFVESFDSPQQILKFETRHGSSKRSISLPLAKECRVTLNGNKTLTPSALKPDDLKAGDRITLQHDFEITELTAVRSQQLAGVIDEVREADGLLIVGTPDGVKHQLARAEREDIEISGEPAALGELRKYDDVRVSYEKQETGTLRAIAVDATRPVKHDRWAIVIGVTGYDDKTLPRTPFATDDARLVNDALRKRYGCAPERTLLLLDLTRTELENRIKSVLEQALKRTQVLIYFAGQGVIGPDGQAYLAGKDFDSKRLESGIKLSSLALQLEACASADKLFLLDTCPSGITDDPKPGVSAAELLDSLKGGGSASAFLTTSAIASCRQGEHPRVWNDRKHGLFGWYVTQAFKGGADKNRDLNIPATELFDYLKQELETFSTTEGQPQTPVMIQGR